MTLKAEDIWVAGDVASERSESDAPPSAKLDRMKQIGLVLAGGLVLMTAWQLCVTWFHIPGYILPAPQKVFDVLWGRARRVTFKSRGFLHCAREHAAKRGGWLRYRRDIWDHPWVVDG